MQPTGDVHLGNLLGAIRNWVAQQHAHESYFCIVDLHAMTVPWDPATLRRRTLHTGALLMAAGLDPERCVLFTQSHVPQHSELAWVLGCVARMGELGRMVQFKERSRRDGESVGVGLFTYPVLQAADVLLYQARWVPVGEDQRQHIELMRDLAVRFNATFGDTFTLPEARIPPAGARIMALDAPDEKMSKSTPRPQSKILLTDPPEVVRKKVKAAVTDSGRDVVAAPDKPALSNLLTIFSLVAGTSVAELEERYRSTGYGVFKTDLADAVVALLEPVQGRYAELVEDDAGTAALLERGAERAASVAGPTMELVRERTGVGRPAGKATARA